MRQKPCGAKLICCIFNLLFQVFILNSGLRFSACRMPVQTATEKKSPNRNIGFGPGISLFYPPRRGDKPNSATHERRLRCPGRSSDFRILLLTAPSQPQWFRTYTTLSRSVVLCGFRPRLQRRARPRISRGSLLSSIGSAIKSTSSHVPHEHLNIFLFYFNELFTNHDVCRLVNIFFLRDDCVLLRAYSKTITN